MAHPDFYPIKCKKEHKFALEHAYCEDCHRYAAYMFFKRATKTIENGCEVYRIINNGSK